jgi:hypothetical protein
MEHPVTAMCSALKITTYFTTITDPTVNLTRIAFNKTVLGVTLQGCFLPYLVFWCLKTTGVLKASMKVIFRHTAVFYRDIRTPVRAETKGRKKEK